MILIHQVAYYSQRKTEPSTRWQRITVSGTLVSQKSNFVKLYLHLRIPNTIRLKTRHVFTGEEALIIFLTRVGGAFSTWKSMELFFGGNPNKWGYLFAMMVDHLYSTFYHKITGDPLRQWFSSENIEYFFSLLWL